MVVINKLLHGGTANKIPGHLSFGQYVIDQLRDLDDGVALVNVSNDHQTTRKEILQLTVNLAAALKGAGFKRGDVVTVCSESRLEMMVSIFSVICCGATVSVANLHYTEYEMKHALNISKPRFIICSQTAIGNHSNTFKNFVPSKQIMLLDDMTDDGTVLIYNNLLRGRNVSVIDFQAEDVQGATDPLFILYSSGTTGLPKGVMLTHVNVLYFAFCNNDDPELKKYLLPVPWFHAYGLMATACYILQGRTMHYMPAFNLELYLNSIQRYKMDIILTVPPILFQINKSPLASKYDLSSVRIVWCAAAPLKKESAIETRNRFPQCRAVLQAYGMTETALTVTLDSEHSAPRPGSGGTAQPGNIIKVVDINTREKLGAHEKGEICVKGPNVMRGYYDNEEATRDVFDDEGFLKTGDIGYYDDEGFIYIVDRLKELIKYKGFQVSPSELEAVLVSHGAVAEAGVTARPDAGGRGELPTAFVVLAPAQRATAQDLQRYVAEKLSDAKHLRGGVTFVKEIPKNASGKILRRVLKDWATKPLSKL